MTTDAPLALVTGGTRGIGAATARRLASDGWRLCLTYRSRADDAEALASDLRAAGTSVDLVRCDVADEDDVGALFDAVDAIGPLSGLVNSAGVLEQQADLVDTDRARWEWVFAVNVHGTVACCRHAVRRMSTARGGRGGAIVNLSSAAARIGSPHEYVDYAASKAAVDTLTRGLALEVADAEVRVNAVRPGIIETEMHASGGEPDRADRLGPGLPIGRAGTAAEVAEAVAWLLSPASSYVTGTLLDVTGGR